VTERQNGTVLFYCPLGDDQYAKLRQVAPDAHHNYVDGILRGDDGFVYAWKCRHTFRDGTTPDKLEAGCRVSFEVNPIAPTFATAISWRLVDRG